MFVSWSWKTQQLATKGDGDRVLGQIITGAPEMLKVAQMIERVANTNASVMLLGASGTGKELLAKGLHDSSDRREAPFVAINCAAIPENLLWSPNSSVMRKAPLLVPSRLPRVRSSRPMAAHCFLMR